MNLTNLQKLTQPPELYEPGTASMWDDDHISGHLLLMHLDETTDAASRKKITIQKTVTWIESHLRENASILDLGCGPGLYCELLAEHGHSVTGVNCSRRSIAHAKEQATRKNLAIEYLCENYLDLSFRSRFDLAIMIYCDFCVLVPRGYCNTSKGMRFRAFLEQVMKESLGDLTNILTLCGIQNGLAVFTH